MPGWKLEYMLNFEPFSLSALKKTLKYIKMNPSRCSDLSAGYLYMWHEGADIRFCIWNDTFTICQMIGEQCAFSYPVGADPDGMIDRLRDYEKTLKTVAANTAATARLTGTGV